MGGSSSAEFDKLYETVQFAGWMETFAAMKLSKGEVQKLYKIFRAVDVDGSGEIALAELLVHIDLERTSFTKRIFSIFDEDSSGEIDFKEFVIALWNYCTLTKSTLGEALGDMET
jgi:Ca2+-binding EF-hand superfamily protein